MNELIFLQEHFFKLVLAALIGGLVGLERGRGGNIGFGTLSILTLSCCFITVLSLELSPNTDSQLRVVAGLLSSVGFIGGGTIFTQRKDDNEKSVKGLTSATIVFFLAIIGIAIGVGYYITAIAVVILAEVNLFIAKIVKKQRNKQDVSNNNAIDNYEF